jgi:hypothetical protein
MAVRISAGMIFLLYKVSCADLELPRLLIHACRRYTGRGFETDDTPPSTAEVANVWNFDWTTSPSPLPNAFVVRTRATLTLPVMGCALDVNLILSLRSQSTALMSVRVHAHYINDYNASFS